MKSIILAISLLFLSISVNAQTAIFSVVDTAYKVETASVGYQGDMRLPHTTPTTIYIKSFDKCIKFDLVNFDENGKPTSGLLYFFCVHNTAWYELQATIYEFN